jgi:hypothetical protein
VARIPVEFTTTPLCELLELKEVVLIGQGVYAIDFILPEYRHRFTAMAGSRFSPHINP